MAIESRGKAALGRGRSEADHDCTSEGKRFIFHNCFSLSPHNLVCQLPHMIERNISAYGVLAVRKALRLCPRRRETPPLATGAHPRGPAAGSIRQRDRGEIVVTGDLFDFPHVTKSTVSSPYAAIGSLGMPVVVIPGTPILRQRPAHLPFS